MIKHLPFLGVFTALHCGLTVLLGIWAIAWQMVLLDSVPLGNHAVAPLGLSLLNGILSLLSLPILPLLMRAALYVGYVDPVNNIIYWCFPPLNSGLAAILVVIVKEAISKYK